MGCFPSEERLEECVEERRLVLYMVNTHWVVFGLDIPCDLGACMHYGVDETLWMDFAERRALHWVHSMASNLITCN